MAPGRGGWLSKEDRENPRSGFGGVASGERCGGVASGAGWGRGPWEEAAERGREESTLLFLWRPRRAEPGELAAASLLEPAGQPDPLGYAGFGASVE